MALVPSSQDAMAASRAGRPGAGAASGDGRASGGQPLGGAGGLRVIMIGRSGLEKRLRLDPAIELIRAKTPLDAVGELANAISQDGGLANVVVVAPGTASEGNASEGAGPTSEPASPGKRRELLAALRRLDPRVRVLRVQEETEEDDIDVSGEWDSDAMEGYDHVLAGDADAEDLRAVLNGNAAAVAAPPAKLKRTDPSRGMPAHDPVEVEAAAPASFTTGAPDGFVAAKGPPDLGDENLVRLLLHGRDILDSAVEVIRGRLGHRDVTFVAAVAVDGNGADTSSARPALSPGMHETSVAWRGRILGKLRSSAFTAERLASHAAWLASWLILRDQHSQLREAAFADPLTGAHNRRYFDQFLAMAIDEARTERRSVTLLMFDIDNFKRFNDRYGHAAGDDILRETVRLLRSVIRPSDKVCRIGGDEFAVIFYEPNGPRTPSSRPPSDVYAIAERFQREIIGHHFPKLGREAPGPLTISGGLATYPWDGMTPDTLLARADELSMQSKRAGKNCITIGPRAEESQFPELMDQ